MEVPYSQKAFGIVPWYSILIVLGIAFSVWLMNREAVRKGLSQDTGIDIALWTVPFGIIGARLYFVAFRWSDYFENPLSVFYIWEGGLAIYGAVIGGALGLFLYSKRKKLSFSMLLDIVAPGLILSQAIGRWGNYFNMEAYGPSIQEGFLQFFPIGVLIHGTEWHMATFFYESCWNFACFIALLCLRRKCFRNGQVFLWYCLFYGSGRFVIEQLREDSLFWAGFRVSQWLSLGLCILSGFLLLKATVVEKRKILVIPASILLISRWFLLNEPVAYGLCSFVSCLLIAVSLGKKSIPWVILTFFMDSFGLLCNVNNLVGSKQMSVLVMELLCSLSFCIHHVLMFLFSNKKTEDTPCQAES